MIAQKLKTETMPLHQQIENENPLLKSTFTVENYKVYLSYLAAFYDQIERQLSELHHELPPSLQIEKRLKLNLINEDLKNLNASAEKLSIKVPTLKNKLQFWGVYYVLEGSTLGGQIISRKLAQNLGLDSTQLLFFKSYGDNTGPMWKAFIEDLNAQNFSEEDEKYVIAAALDGFHSYGELLKQINADI